MTSSNKYKILVIEDEANIRSFVETILETNGYQVFTAGSCRQGMLMYSSYCPDLIILDLGLPDADGLEFIRYARKSGAVPILVLSARTSEKDKVSALDLGANDYITKPFGTAELMARVRAALRNSRHSSEMGAVPGGIFQVRDLVIDYDRRQVTVAGKEINLTQTEYNIVTLLSEQAGKVLTYSQIICAVWGGTDSGSVKKLQVNMANIRKKLGTRPGDRKYISNELGVGYRMLADEE
ncbi:MAG TPA: response regulator transcription factor [Candidatus Scatomonas merdigallinarum]|nr:response regulator transcription factor [Candidatus Scatomonas merdigallinarum]